MAKQPTTKLDFDKMSDEDFLKLDEDEYIGNVPDGETTLSNNEVTDDSGQVSNENSDLERSQDFDTHSDNNESGDAGDNANTDSNLEDPNAAEEDPEAGKQADPMAGEGSEAESEIPSSEQPEADSEEEGKTASEEDPDGVKPKGKDTPAKAGYYKLPEGMDSAAVDAALGFYEKVTTPFKADGKDFTVRSPEDAIRLMQQGVNYSRRMQEIKPMKALNRMLTDHELNDPNKLNFLIDLSKGNKEAITQLLKSHNIDPMDLDTEKESGYQARNYQGDPQDNEFRDALDVALTTPDGQALVNHIHRDWDKQSKTKLRENPGIIGNLQDLKASGVYDKVVQELEYQKSMGYMLNVPFLQAFDQVGEAMKNAGVFQEAPQNPGQGNSMAPLKNVGQPQSQPVASGGRKPQAPSKPPANPHLSSTPPSRQSGNSSSKPTDFDKMSDEEFAKLAPPE